MHLPRSSRGRTLLVVGGATLAAAIFLHLEQTASASLSRTPPPPPMEAPGRPTGPPSPASAPREEDDTAEDRAQLLRWADGIKSSMMASELERIQKIASPVRRAALREALLFSWTSRDLVAVARWVGTLGPAHELQQEGREQLVQALLQCDPEEVVPALRECLPEATSRELLGPYFRAWAGSSPAVAADMLARLAAAEPRDPAPWHDLGAQVAAQWVAIDPPAAIAWLRSLPEGAGKSAALLQASHHWTEIDPLGASAYAAESEDLRVIRAVASRWAETSPSAALAWARSLPVGSMRTEALSGAAAIWAQNDPQAATAWANNPPADASWTDAAESPRPPR